MAVWNCTAGRLANITLLLFSAVYAVTFLPSLWLFFHGVEPGMNHIDRVYPYPQPREPLYKNPVLIYTHLYASIIALGLLISLLVFHPPYVSPTTHRRLAWSYKLLVVPGTLSSILYATQQDYGNDGGRSGTFAFSVMAFATFYTLANTLYYRYIRDSVVLHREWALRNFAVLFGNGVLFRVLANTYLVYMPRWGADFYASWCQMIYLSWIVPLFLVEQYLAWERSKLEDRSTCKGRVDERVKAGK